MNAIAKGEVTGVRQEGLRLRDFVDKKYWPVVQGRSRRRGPSDLEASSTSSWSYSVTGGCRGSGTRRSSAGPRAGSQR
jgi:hypothetical protein